MLKRYICNMKILKVYILLLVISYSFFGCNKSDKTQTYSKTYFHPPAWIQGTWVNNDLGAEIGYRFTENDLVTVGGLSGDLSNNKIMWEQEQSGWKPSVAELFEPSLYRVDLNRPGMVVVYNFKLIDETHICDDIKGLGCNNVFYVKK